MGDVKVDTSAIADLGKQIERAKRMLLGRLAEKGYKFLREEVPKVTTNLQQGVAPPDVDYDKMTATLTVSARSARAAGGKATLHLQSGKTKSVSLRPQPAFNYAEVVARGRAAIAPHSAWRPGIKGKSGARALLIPVASAPSDESYLEFNGKIYVVRRSAKATKPNPFDERAATRLEKEIPTEADKVLRKIFNEQ